MKEIHKSEALQATNRRLKELESMQGMFLDIVGHELRTPLALIKGYVHLLQRSLGRPEAAAALADCTVALGQATQRLERLVQQLLDFSQVRTGSGEPTEEVALGELVLEAVSELSSLARQHQVELRTRLPEQGQPLAVEREHMREALIHLIKNAIVYNQPDGWVEVSLEQGDSRSLLEIEDSGVGIPEEELERVFSPFYQVGISRSRAHEGLGLGLALARLVVLSHGGHIELDSHPGQGTRVRIELPHRPARAARTLTPPEPPPVMGERELLAYTRQLYDTFEAERARVWHLEETARAMEATYLQSVGHLLALCRPDNLEQMARRSRVNRIAAFLVGRCHRELVDDRAFSFSLILLELSRIGVAQPLLQRAGSLVASERQLVEAYSEGCPEVRDALVTLRHLFERWDGKGYPERLEGEAIPAASRVLALADGVDRLLEPGHLRPGFDLESVRQQIERQSGRWFEPALVEALGDFWAELPL